jgi:hypothetical protein
MVLSYLMAHLYIPREYLYENGMNFAKPLFSAKKQQPYDFCYIFAKIGSIGSMLSRTNVCCESEAQRLISCGMATLSCAWIWTDKDERSATICHSTESQPFWGHFWGHSRTASMSLRRKI